MDLKAAAAKARELSGELYKGSCPRYNSRMAKEPCLHAEETRKLTPAEKRQGWTRRPFYAYDHGRMCPTCAAYWHASMASMALDREARLAEREKAEKENRG